MVRRSTTRSTTGSPALTPMTPATVPSSEPGAQDQAFWPVGRGRGPARGRPGPGCHVNARRFLPLTAEYGVGVVGWRVLAGVWAAVLGAVPVAGSAAVPVAVARSAAGLAGGPAGRPEVVADGCR